MLMCLGCQEAAMKHVEKVIEVNRPVTTVYNQWTQFEDFPDFMHGVEDVRQLDATHVHWKARIWGKQMEWDAEITEQEPDRRISWKSVAGAHNAGTVRFKPLGKDRTKVTLVLAYRPDGALERAGNTLGPVRSRVKNTLRNFKNFIEDHGSETGAWRGEVVEGEANAQPVVHRAEGWSLLS
jgi:uncharacterized membrane protein